MNSPNNDTSHFRDCCNFAPSTDGAARDMLALHIDGILWGNAYKLFNMNKLWINMNKL